MQTLGLYGLDVKYGSSSPSNSTQWTQQELAFLREGSGVWGCEIPGLLLELVSAGTPAHLRFWCFPGIILLSGRSRGSCSFASPSAKALPDDFGCLGPKQCHIVRAGEVFTGKAWAISTIIVSSFVILPYCGSKVAVWRYPIMLPSDVDVWEAVPLPACADFVCRNCVYCSVQTGFVAVSRFAFESSACRSTTQGL